MPTTKVPHIGRKIERIRMLKGIKQETLASLMGTTQGAISKIEQCEAVDDEKLKIIAEALNVPMETIKNFDEDALLGTSNFINPSFQDNSTAVINQFNPLEKIVELYERLLEVERKRNEQLETLLKDKK